MSNVDAFHEGDPDRRRIHEETVSAADGPIDFYLGNQHLRIVSPERDLEEAWNIDYLVIDEGLFDESDGKAGFKGIGDGEEIVLGRSSKYGRFHFLRNVSREHVRITRSGDEFTIADLGSLNGTFLKNKKQPDRRITAPVAAEETLAETIEIPEAAPDTELSFTVAGESKASELHPDRNEDAYFVDSESRAIGVFDGLGGHAGSERASECASEAVREYLAKLPQQMPRTLANEAMREALQTAHEQIVAESENSGIATTGTVGKVFETEHGTEFLVIGSVGDSRAYLFRDGEFNHVTLDQAYFTGLSEDRAKHLQDTLSQATDLSSLNENERAAFVNRNVIKGCLGIAEEPPVVVLSDMEIQSGDRLLITSDGIHDNLTSSEVEAVLKEAVDPEQAVRVLVASAQARSRDNSHLRAKPDDMTAAVLDCDELR
jgi:protein phosphatase